MLVHELVQRAIDRELTAGGSMLTGLMLGIKLGAGNAAHGQLLYDASLRMLMGGAPDGLQHLAEVVDGAAIGTVTDTLERMDQAEA